MTIKLLIDKYATAWAARDIPTGDLYRSIAQNQLIETRKELYDALEYVIETAFYRGYNTRSIVGSLSGEYLGLAINKEWELIKKLL